MIKTFGNDLALVLKMRPLYAALIGVLCHWAPVLAQDKIEFIDNDFEAAIVSAEKEGKLIFINGYTTWCLPCKVMEEEVFSLGQVARHFNSKFINVSVDLEKGIGPILAARYGAEVIPSYYFISHDQTLVYQFAGLQGVADILDHADEAHMPERLLQAWELRYLEGDRKPDFLFNYIDHLDQTGDIRFDKVLDEYLEGQSDWTTSKNMRLVYRFANGVDNALYDHLIVNRKMYEKMMGKDDFDAKIERLVAQAINDPSKEMSLDQVERLLIRSFPGEGVQKAYLYKLSVHHKKKLYGEMAVDITGAIKAGAQIHRDTLLAYTDEITSADQSTKTLSLATKWVKELMESSNYARKPTMKLVDLYQMQGHEKAAGKILQKAAKQARKSRDMNLRREYLEYRKSISK